ncbi:uncharacterized protein LOC112346169 [Selaginella moellendorffii]|uniref:uncharacterized protein LOC112346169 n=1 Tax=Selaginella moellendorffii TaxID=88036 RepID=UPI000D1C5118|nr:uncharacterized protein LOC112346169 [Selaginella moellendorffii]|eukprot:XP_024530223.1 uncharacterized protein LOC112346169 [Selaginella moellendorffii]
MHAARPSARHRQECNQESIKVFTVARNLEKPAKNLALKFLPGSSEGKGFALLGLDLDREEAMVATLKPARFYGDAMPRPHIYYGTYLNTERVDPPPPVNEALLQWAKDAHWSMGGLSSKRTRMQGKIEGRISKLRSEEDEGAKLPAPSSSNEKKKRKGVVDDGGREEEVPLPSPANDARGSGRKSRRKLRKKSQVAAADEEAGVPDPPSSSPENESGEGDLRANPSSSSPKNGESSSPPPRRSSRISSRRNTT